MANRLKFRETITKAEHYIRKLYDNLHQTVFIDTYRKRKHNEKIIMNSTHIKYKEIYNMCYLTMFYFRFENQKKFFFLPRQAKSERNTPLELRN